MTKLITDAIRVQYDTFTRMYDIRDATATATFLQAYLKGV